MFLAEAQTSGNFDRLLVAYRRDEVIRAIRKNNGYFFINIAHQDHIEKRRIGPIEIYNINSAADRKIIISAVAQAGEIATALSSVGDYVSKENSIHQLIAQGLNKKISTDPSGSIIYTAENDTHAAQKLQNAILSDIEQEQQKIFDDKVQILNTVIGKMSIRIKDINVIKKQGLATITPSLSQAFLVEEFSHILIDKISLKDFNRGINSFVEKDNLYPFEEAKLYGHNAIHAMAAYLALVLGVKHIKDLDENVVELLRAAFMQEVGPALIKKHKGIDDLFTVEGFRGYAENLLKRMQNPFLNDTAERVARDVERKLGWNDRLIGAMRLCLEQNIEPNRLALGVGAALQTVNQTGNFSNYLTNIWRLPNDNKSREVLDLIGRVIQEEKILQFL